MLARFFRRKKPERHISKHRFDELIEYAKRRNRGSHSKWQGDDRWIGRNISFQYEERTMVPHVDGAGFQKGEAFLLPLSISWNWAPHSLAVCLIDGQIELRASHGKIGPRIFMPKATDPVDIAEIRRCFDFWYEFYDLPASLDRPTHPPKQFVRSGDGIADIRTYLKNGSEKAFYELFEDDGPIVWVDWKEEDDRIVAAFAEVLQLDDLSVSFDNHSCDLLIRYRGVEHRIVYPVEGVAERDATLIGLNSLLSPQHAIRLCKASRGSDTLAFLALSQQQWAALESEFGQALADCFEPIKPGLAIFG